MVQPLVSVIIPTYRRDVELKRAIQSIKIQSYKHIEIIIVDDNANRYWNDKVLSIVSDFSNVSYVRNVKNLGSAETRNKGIRLAKGEYITFLDDDDLYSQDKVKNQLFYMIKYNADYSLTDLYLYDENNCLVDIRKRNYIKKYDMYSLLQYHFMYHMTGTDVMMFRTTYLKKINGFPSIDIGDEFYLMERAIFGKGVFVYFPECNVKAFVHKQSGLSSGEEKIIGEISLFEHKKKYFCLFNNNTISYIKMRHYAVLAFFYIKKRQYLLFFKEAILSWYMAPQACFNLLYILLKTKYIKEISNIGDVKKLPNNNFCMYIHELFSRLKFVRIRDVFSFFPMLLGFFFAQFYKIKHPHLWVICEREYEARDNGFFLFKYIKEHHVTQDVVYAINLKSPDYYKVKTLGKVIPFGSLKHWICYFAAERNISSQKDGKPNAVIGFFLEVCLHMRRNRVFLQHGITKDNLKWGYYKVSRIQLFTCTTESEYEYVKQTFGYPREAVKLVGMCRFDNLLVNHIVKKQILVMPTWREWLGHISKNTIDFEDSVCFEESEYYKRWNSFLKNKYLSVFLEKYGYQLFFYPHANMQKYLGTFENNSPNIIVASQNNFDVQTLLMESSVLITDYSSIYFDFAYMKKPIIYYQFDYDKYRKGQYEEGYFSYKNDGFGKIAKDENLLIAYIKEILVNKCKVEPIYMQRMRKFFTFHDMCNCERTYLEIEKMQDK
jgi:CDP-glycerol glycerophosphotransferase (TagB/SpsB family)/glycosyltransferase involved in cell wall biosynthesis